MKTFIDGKLVYKADRGDWSPITEADLDRELNVAHMNAWDVACVIGMVDSLEENGFADSFDGMDYHGFALDLMSDMGRDMVEVTPRRLYEWWKAAE